MRSTRLTQPFRKGSRPASPALQAMLRGRSMSGHNPMDNRRAMQVMIAAGKRRRPKRPVRPARPPRPPR